MRYILFVKKTCPFCIKAERLLKEKALDYKLVAFEHGQESVLQEIKEAHDWKTVPMIFHREGNLISFIGGYTDLLGHFEE